MDRLLDLLSRARQGNAVLFCGAGFTADCLNFDDPDFIGVSSHLLKILNAELADRGKTSGYKDLKVAAKKYKQEVGNHSLMMLLKNRFKINNVSASVSDILEYPWSKIYTTNYDNGIELGLQHCKQKYQSINNIDEMEDVPANSTPVLHLHGFADAWTDQNFETSLVLDSDSYRLLSGVKRRLAELRQDIERAQVVVFVGFSAADVHLDQIFFDISGLKEKAFFINRVSAEPDLDERATQEDYGVPLYIGRDGFASILLDALTSQEPQEPKLASFQRYEAAAPSQAVPPVNDIEDLLIWGRLSLNHLKRDHDIQISDYHVLRQDVQSICKKFATPGCVMLLHGDICDGKTVIAQGVASRLFAVRPVFLMKHPYDDLLSEAASIFKFYGNAVLILENCFTLRDDRLLGLVKMVSAGAGNLLLTARSISTEAESGKLKALRQVDSFSEMNVSKLVGDETNALVALIDQIAGWKEFKALTRAERQRFVEDDCHGVVPNVLLRLLKSDYVRKRYQEEFVKISHLDQTERRMIIVALLISNIGFDAPVSFVSNIFERDFATAIWRSSLVPGGMNLIRVEGAIAKTVPSIGARNLLNSVVPDREVVDATIFVLEKIAQFYRRSDFEQTVFSQLMRYSILSSAVSDVSEVNRFFDHISKIGYFRDMPLFWLQWHMAMTAQERWLDAEKYLGMGYTAAEAYDKKRDDKFNRKQLDDRRAKFLAARARSTHRSGAELFRDLKDSLDIAGRLLRSSELTHHPFETLRDVARLFEERAAVLPDAQKHLVLSQMDGTSSHARKRIGEVAEGYQRKHSKAAVDDVDQILKAHGHHHP